MFMDMNKKRKIRLVSLFVSAFIVLMILTACGGGASRAQRADIYAEIDEAISRNDFVTALQMVIDAQGAQRPLYDNNNVISLFLNKGLLEFYAGLHADSAESLLNAERLIQEAFTRSISQNVASFILNDNTKEYPGEDFEDIYLTVFNALNFYHQGSIEAALVEIRKLTLPSGKLELLSRKYDDGNARIRGEHGDALNQAESAEGASTPVSRNTTFSNSALARYLSILFYEADRNPDAVRIEMEQFHAAFANQPTIYTQSVPRAINLIAEGSGDMARLDVLTFVGLSPIKEEETLQQYWPIFTGSNRYANINLPRLVERPNRVDRIEIVVGDETFRLELLEDMGTVIVDTFNARYTQIFLKTYIRTLVKHTALEIAQNQAAERGGALAGMGARLAGGLLIEASERADVRISRYLPNGAFVGGVLVEPGTYTVTANFYSQGQLVRTKTRENMEIRANRLNLAQFSNLDFIYAFSQIQGG
ncbi:MAG: hypothetical protein FWG98_13430 [Candidatus Cloacimonetes bacterium]|nr:hypothetical protein [Candidatus Cloacimonadota bacterium]